MKEIHFQKLKKKAFSTMNLSACQSRQMGVKMLEAKYYKDYHHNYMILRCEQRKMMNSYQHKILTSDKIGEILRCSVRHINGATYYYYDISSRTTLEGLYRGRRMSYAQVKDMLLQLCGICEKLSGYFMEEAKLVLQPEHIYYDLTNHKYIGLYYPDYQEEENPYRPLMDFLLEHVDTEDEQLTEEMYRLYEMSEEKHFCLEDALKLLEDKEEGQGVPDLEKQEKEADAQWETIAGQMEESQGLYIEPETFPMKETGETQRGKRNIFYPVFMILSLFGIVGALAVGQLYELTQEEQLALYGSVAAMGACALICLAGMAGAKKKRTYEKGNRQKAYGNPAGEPERAPAGEHFTDETTLPLERIISHDMNLDIADDKPKGCGAGKYDDDAQGQMNVRTGQVCEDYGNTVFFDESALEECKLYAMDRKNKRHIELKQFPCTVGKMAGCVDYVLPDDSVSRIHARFDRQGDKVTMTDMNSTNGTYKNGLRIQPQETVMIEPGDEIRFGSLNYCYR